MVEETFNKIRLMLNLAYISIRLKTCLMIYIIMLLFSVCVLEPMGYYISGLYTIFIGAMLVIFNIFRFYLEIV